jgi:C-terminal processing protease CtpA/Prc
VPTVVLFGHDTGSAAEDFLIAADNQKHFIKMGQRSFGSTGQPLSFGLPGGGSARICTKRDTYADGREFVGVGIIPEIEIIPTLNDFINKYDRTLDEAIKVVSKQIK